MKKMKQTNETKEMLVQRNKDMIKNGMRQMKAAGDAIKEAQKESK